jgi:hypothetical protein
MKSISFSDKEVKLIEEEAIKEERSFTEIVRKIIDRYFEEKSKLENL